MKRHSILVWIVVITASTSVYSADWQLDWVPGYDIPGTWYWNIYSSHHPYPVHPPGTYGFSGPTGVFGNSCYAAADLGGIPTITIEPYQKTIELWFKPPAPTLCPAVWLPVCGLNGWVGPLYGGDWIFYSNEIPSPYGSFSINFHVDGPHPTLTILKPNGGERLPIPNRYRTYTIKWEDSRSEGYCGGNYLLDYSTDDGNSWIPVDSNTISNTCSYDWKLPLISSNQCLIRITDADDPNISDTSDDSIHIYLCFLPISGDLNSDCYVDFDDFSILAAGWNVNSGSNMNDLASFVESWLDCINLDDPSCSN
ncbi:MAG: hypothetical protein ACYSSN_08210 [Planctomycetota bacterium]|jgi:hypothetical protein